LVRFIPLLATTFFLFRPAGATLSERSSSPSSTPHRDWTTTGLGIVVLGLLILAWLRGGPALALDGIEQGLATLWSVVPLLIAAFLVAGFTQTLISRSLIERWLARIREAAP
jgi:hypothetical protein